MTESSDETTPLDGSPATAPDGSTQKPGSPVTSGEPLPDVEPEPVPEIEPESVPEIEPEPEPEPEPEREPIVVSAEDLPTAIETVRTAIRAGESVVFPTDTVYGLSLIHI